MDLVRTPPRFDLYDPDWMIFSRSAPHPPHFLSESARVSESIVTEGCRIYGRVHGSVLFRGVTVGNGASVINSIVFPGAHIEAEAVVENAILGTGSRVRRGVVIKNAAGEKISVLGDGEIRNASGGFLQNAKIGGI